jgi:hypothetical protein
MRLSTMLSKFEDQVIEASRNARDAVVLYVDVVKLVVDTHRDVKDAIRKDKQS